MPVLMEILGGFEREQYLFLAGEGGAKSGGIWCVSDSNSYWAEGESPWEQWST